MNPIPSDLLPTCRDPTFARLHTSRQKQSFVNRFFGSGSNRPTNSSSSSYPSPYEYPYAYDPTTSAFPSSPPSSSRGNSSISLKSNSSVSPAMRVPMSMSRPNRSRSNTAESFTSICSSSSSTSTSSSNSSSPYMSTSMGEFVSQGPSRDRSCSPSSMRSGRRTRTRTPMVMLQGGWVEVEEYF